MCLYSGDDTINHNENEDENEKRLHRYHINRPSSRHGHKYSKYKKCLSMTMLICDALHDLVPFVQFKKREEHPWRSVNFSKVAGLKQHLKLNS